MKANYPCSICAASLAALGLVLTNYCAPAQDDSKGRTPARTELTRSNAPPQAADLSSRGFGIGSPALRRLPDYDTRKATAGAAARPPDSQAAALARLRQRLPRVKVDFDEILGTPKFISTPDGFLSGTNGEGRGIGREAVLTVPADDPLRALKAFVNDHATLFGYGAEVLAEAREIRNYVTPHNGLRTVIWEQQLDGIPLFQARLKGHITKQGELVNISSQFIPKPEAAAAKGTPNRAAVQADSIITAPQALVVAVGDIGQTLRLENVEAVDPNPVGADKLQTMRADGIWDGAKVRLVWLPLDCETLRLCWEVQFTESARLQSFRTLVDAQDGKGLVRHFMTSYDTVPAYRVFTGDSPSPFSPGHSVPMTNLPKQVSRLLVVTNAMNASASPYGWIENGLNETCGPNVDTGLYNKFWSVPWLRCRPPGSPYRVFDFQIDFAQPPSTYSNAAVVNAFYWCNWMHDRLFGLVPFFPTAGTNDTCGTRAHDFSTLRVAAQADLPFGLYGSGEIFLGIILENWGPRDLSFDTEVVMHEYTHFLVDLSLSGHWELQTRGLNEGWAYWYPLTLLSEPEDDPAGTYPFAGWMSADYYFGGLRYPVSVNTSKNPLTFKDIDPNQADLHAGVPLGSKPWILPDPSEEHNAAEVWCAPLWDARANLICKYGYAVGNEMMLQLVTDGLALSPPNPNFLEARDAILQADRVLTGGANLMELWQGFAKRGMGVSASSPGSSTTVEVVESFDLPDALDVGPLGLFTASGPLGGPFSPWTQLYVVTNNGGDSICWEVGTTASWLELFPAGGCLGQGWWTSEAMIASVADSTTNLPVGVYSGTIWFTNVTTGFTLSRQVKLLVGQPNYFTESFTGDNDLDFTTVTFSPDGSTSYYRGAACLDPRITFPTDPTGGEVLPLADDSFAQVQLQLPFYGTTYDSFYVGANGYVTFGAGDDRFEGRLLAHFSLPRVAGLFCDLDPSSGGTVSWLQLGDRVAVTYENVPEYGRANSNSFQIELFFDGRVRVTWLRVDATNGLAGLSQGRGWDPHFQESDLTALPPLAEPPFGETQPPENVGANGAVLRGEVIPAGLDTRVWFRWGTNWPPQIATPATNVGNGCISVPVSATLTGLAPCTPYCYSLVASNRYGENWAGIYYFATAELPATAVTLPATRVSPSDATLHGTVNPNGAETVAWFEWGMDANYGSTVGLTNVGAGTTPLPVSAALSNLMDNTPYYYRLVASNCAGLALGNDMFFGPPFFQVPVFLGSSEGPAVWGDYDNDGRLDVLFAGQVFQNTPTGFFEIVAGLPYVRNAAVAWGDYDNDGRLDILLAGEDSSSQPIAQVWRNTGAGFVNIGAGLPGVRYGAVAWDDYDNDGRRDILLAGEDASAQPVTQVWRNTGAGFTNIEAGLTGVRYASVAWGDQNNDGRLDILLAGEDASGQPITQIWRNTGGMFSDIQAGLPGLRQASVAWGDFDNDHLNDVLLSGEDASFQPLAQVWRNRGSYFTNVPVALPGIRQGAAAWGDCDNDGRLDIMLTGYTDTGGVAQVWRNTGGSFTNIQADFWGFGWNSVAWGDYDNDGRLDLLLAASGMAQLWRNLTPLSNAPPSTPTALKVRGNGTSAQMTWTAATDSRTPRLGLTHNLCVGTAPGGCDVMSPHAEPTNGWRRVPQPGNAWTSWGFTLEDLQLGTTYYWSVQAVDTSFAGSPFATEATFVAGYAPDVSMLAVTNLHPTGAALTGMVNPNGAGTRAWFEWRSGTNWNKTAMINLGSGMDFLPVSATLTGLTAGTTYYWRLVATNSSGWTEANAAPFTLPPFQEVPVGLPALSCGSVAWGDYDNDGRLDVLLAGLDASWQPIAEVWRNTGAGFTNINAGLPGVQNGAVAWGDYDNDGRLDILLTGYDLSYQPISQVWRNTGTGFVNSGAGLPGVGNSSAAWGDFDNDGRLDILLTGYDSSYLAISQVWRNTGTGFTNIHAVLPGVQDGSVAWGDYDNDGLLDILITGYDSSYEPISQLWRNTGSGFTNIGAALPGGGGGSAAWGDDDNDGRLDILLTGQGTNSPLIQVWRNTGGGFTNINAFSWGGYCGSAAWGDYDNDGRLDILLGAGMGADAEVWRKSGSGFVRGGTLLVGVGGTAGAWGDYDNDGRLDVLLIGGRISGQPAVQLWKNCSTRSNAPPTAPTGLTATCVGFEVTLSWNAPTDDKTPAPGLSYNVRLGTTPGGSDVISPHANVASGWRRMPQLGNAQAGVTFSPTNLQAGVTYYWSVQAVDTTFAGSPFAAEAVFRLGPSVETGPATELQPGGATLNGTANPHGPETLAWFQWGPDTDYGNTTPASQLATGTNAIPITGPLTNLAPGLTYHYRIVASNMVGVALGADAVFTAPLFAQTPLEFPGVGYGCSVAWGDFDNDSRLDILLAGSGTNGPIAEVWRNTGNGFISINAGLPGVGFGSSVAWGDYDNDGRLDILLTGLGTNGSLAELWRNTGSGFTNINAGLPGVYYGSAAWGDFDNDGRLDIALTGVGSQGSIAQVWRNTGSGFSNINAGLPGVYMSSVAWGDYDNDGRLDLLLGGGPQEILQVWRNTGAGFTNVGAGLTGIERCSAAWGDYDNDGRLDIALAGYTAMGLVAQVWRNTGFGFTNIDAALPGLQYASLAWGDCDNDGRLDLLLTGWDVAWRPCAQVWRNTGNGFTEFSVGLPGVYDGSVAWGDYDNDGRLDILLAGHGASGFIAQVWRNYSPQPNSPPAAPGGLTATCFSTGVRLSWNAATDGQTPAAGLTYNLRVGTEPGMAEIVSPHAELTGGWRRVSQPGNAQHRLFSVLTDLPPDLYIWNVQAVDAAFGGGPFSAGSQFYVGPCRILDVALLPGSSLQLICGGHAALTYVVQSSTNLVNWIDRTNAVAGANGWFQCSVATDPGASQCFYRLRWP